MCRPWKSKVNTAAKVIKRYEATSAKFTDVDCQISPFKNGKNIQKYYMF